MRRTEELKTNDEILAQKFLVDQTKLLPSQRKTGGSLPQESKEDK
jgi:hypothetical protein